MSRWNDLFEENPPHRHTEKMIKAARSALEQNQKESRRAWLQKWSFWSLGTALAGFLSIWFIQGQRPTESHFVEFADLTETLTHEGDDVDLLETTELLAAEADLEFLENLDLIDSLEEDV